MPGDESSGDIGPMKRGRLGWIQRDVGLDNAGAERNKYGLPIGDFLYEHAREKASSSQAQEPQPSTPRMGENSRQLFEETKQRTYKQLFDLLTCKDSEGQLQAETICLDGLDSDLRAFLQPMVSFLDSSQHRMEFEAFCAALDYQRQHAVMPTAHLFTQRNSRGKEKANPETPVPKIDQNSVRLASKRRSRSVPLHVQLFRERDVRDARMEERRLLAEEAELQECTFRPRVGRHNGRSWSSRSFRQDSPGVNSSPSSSPQVQSFEPSRSTGAAPAPRTPRGPGAPGGPGVATVAASTPRPEGSLGLATPTSGLDSLRGER
ncbi:unnamed protein product [Durusdinium trenchii]|uniref:Uncharacterized protein n=1 Tax=Durusdinium trenchii TaxID=1381693 RepID=A0ABP0PSU8_9DINO